MFLTIYLSLEALTIVRSSSIFLHLFHLGSVLTSTVQSDAVGVTAVPWVPLLFREAQKYWFYSIATSALTQLYALYALWSSSNAVSRATQKSREKAGIKAKLSSTSNTKNNKIYRQLASDVCDLLIPGSFLGWIKVDAMVVGIAMSTSSLFSMSDLWTQINGAGPK